MTFILGLKNPSFFTFFQEILEIFYIFINHIIRSRVSYDYFAWVRVACYIYYLTHPYNE